MILIISRTEGDGHGAEMVLNNFLTNYPAKTTLAVVTAINSSVHKTCSLNNIIVYPVKFLAERYLSNLFIVEKLLKRLKTVKVVHAWHAKSFEIGWYISKRLNVPFTCTVHDHPRSNIYSKRKLWLLKKIANNSKGIICVSHSLKKECIANGFKNCIEVIWNGLPNKHYILINKLR